jgi:hypothetical protein
MGRALDLCAEIDLDASGEDSMQSGGVLWRAVAALAIGALLGALAGMRYDLVFGLSEPLCVIVQSAVFTAAWTSIGVQPVERGPTMGG